MGIRWEFIVAVAVLPVAIMILGGKLAPKARRSLVLAIFATWAVAAIAHRFSVSDPSNSAALLRFYFVILPLVTVPVAVVVATRLRRSGEGVAAAILGLLGWAIGLVVLYCVPIGRTGEICWRVVIVAPPAIYTACGAVIAANLRKVI